MIEGETVQFNPNNEIGWDVIYYVLYFKIRNSSGEKKFCGGLNFGLNNIFYQNISSLETMK